MFFNVVILISWILLMMVAKNPMGFFAIKKIVAKNPWGFLQLGFFATEIDDWGFLQRFSREPRARKVFDENESEVYQPASLVVSFCSSFHFLSLVERLLNFLSSVFIA